MATQVYRATNEALVSPGSLAGWHFMEPNSALRPSSIPSSSPSSRGLQELSASQVNNRNLACNSPKHNQNQKLYLKSTSIKLPGRTSSSRGPRRSSSGSDTFKPLEVVLEESIVSAGSLDATGEQSPSTADVVSPKSNIHEAHPLFNAKPQSESPYLHHLTGQFEWLIFLPASVNNVKDRGSLSNGENDRNDLETQVYGCTLLSRMPQDFSPDHPDGGPEANLFDFIATPLIPEEYQALGLDPSQTPTNHTNMSLPPPPAYELHQTVPLKVSEMVEVVEQAVSPSLTLISERGSSCAGSSRNGSFSVPRIEDSFEELDKLEDELEAVNAFTQTRRITLDEKAAPSTNHLELPSASKRPAISKRASMVGMSATVRIKQPEKPQISIRRATSLVFREKKQDDLDISPKPKVQFSREKLPISQSASPKTPVKSTRPTTVPNFELPGEAVSRRLKEQREARRAQQANAQKAYVPPPRPKSSKPLTKPTFELPGEVISRRKREEREARLRAQAEEEQKKREFKARPMRNSVTPASIPRETITSLARQGKLSQDGTAKQAPATKTNQLSSIGPRVAPSSENKAPQSRGRLSTTTSREDPSRGTSASTGSGAGKRATLTTEEASQLRHRGKEIFQRDNTSYTRDREREKRMREEALRLAREQAAERSRIASREWAEKKRRKEQIILEPPGAQ
ncbi:Ff.00g009100.m01.CDS01 [Fusarium sp. VM40]|nr:Ff.00g009100.m01.CDS01 [Fusarium sp. VM40]